MVSEIREDLNRVKYTSLDFDTHIDDILSRMQVEFASDFNDFALSSLGIVLLDLVSFGLDTLSFYLDRRATDNFLQTARTRASVSRLTRQLGYKMRGAIASSTDIQMAITEPFSLPVLVPANTQLNGPNGLIFETSRSITFPAFAGTAQPLLVPAFQGQTLTESFVSDGTSNQVFSLTQVPDEQFVVHGTISVEVDGALWEEKEFLEFEKTNHYEFSPNDEPPTVRFGDGSAGNIPPVGSAIDVTFVATNGKSGRVNANTITELTAPIVVNATEIQFSITNPSPSSGGDDAESLESAKTFASKVFKTRDVAITRSDYESLAGSFADPLFGRVAVAQAIRSRSGNSDLELLRLISELTAAVSLTKPTIDTAVASASTNVTSIIAASLL